MAEIIIKGNVEALQRILDSILSDLSENPVLDYGLMVETKGLDPAFTKFTLTSEPRNE